MIKKEACDTAKSGASLKALTPDALPFWPPFAFSGSTCPMMGCCCSSTSSRYRRKPMEGRATPRRNGWSCRCDKNPWVLLSFCRLRGESRLHSLGLLPAKAFPVCLSVHAAGPALVSSSNVGGRAECSSRLEGLPGVGKTFQAAKFPTTSASTPCYLPPRRPDRQRRAAAHAILPGEAARPAFVSPQFFPTRADGTS